MFNAAKRRIERLLAGETPRRFGRWLSRDRGLVLAYHNVVPDDETRRGERSLHLSYSAFVAQLDVLTRSHEIVPLTDLVSTPAGAATPRVAITFDDGYRGAVRIGLEECAVRGIPATMFVVPGLVGERSFRWDVVAERWGGSMPGRVRAEVLRGRDPGGGGERGGELGPWHASATEEELVRASGLPGITIGSHSQLHHNLTLLPERELLDDLTQSLHWIAARFRSAIRLLSYPYGLATRRVEAAAASAGFDGAVVVSGGWMRKLPPGNRYHIPRLNVPAEISTEGFSARVWGLLPW